LSAPKNIDFAGVAASGAGDALQEYEMVDARRLHDREHVGRLRGRRVRCRTHPIHDL